LVIILVRLEVVWGGKTALEARLKRAVAFTGTFKSRGGQKKIDPPLASRDQREDVISISKKKLLREAKRPGVLLCDDQRLKRPAREKKAKKRKWRGGS